MPTGIRTRQDQQRPDDHSHGRKMQQFTQQSSSSSFIYQAAASSVAIKVSNTTGAQVPVTIKQIQVTTTVPIDITWDVGIAPTSLQMSCRQCLVFKWNASSFHGLYADIFVGK
jgi:hypothetical protein